MSVDERFVALMLFGLACFAFGYIAREFWDNENKNKDKK